MSRVTPAPRVRDRHLSTPKGGVGGTFETGPMVKESDLKECSYFLVRYVPDVVKGEFINIGVFLFCPDEQFLDCEFSDDWRRLKRFHPQADTEFFKLLQTDFDDQIKKLKEELEEESRKRKESVEDQIKRREEGLRRYVRDMQQSYSNFIQLSAPRACLTPNLRAQLQDLFERHVGVPIPESTEQDTRVHIKQRMTDSLSRYGVLEHEWFDKRIPAAQWTAVGDPFAFDFGYKPLERAGRPNGRLKLIHSVSLRRDPKLTEALMWTFERVLHKERSTLTVGHEDNPDLSNPQVRFSLSVLQHEHVRLVPVSGFDEYAQSVRAELSI